MPVVQTDPLGRGRKVGDRIKAQAADGHLSWYRIVGFWDYSDSERMRQWHGSEETRYGGHADECRCSNPEEWY